MDLEQLLGTELKDEVPQLLSNGSVHDTVLYRIDAGTAYDGVALLVQISKTAAENKERAIVYQFQRLLVYCQLLTEPFPDGQGFLKLLLQEMVVTNIKGTVKNSADVINFYKSLTKEVLENEEGEFLKEGKRVTELPPLEDNVCSVIAFADEWKEILYFIETMDHWLLLSWMTDV